jgi:uncharacterized DUF497 family protein
MEFDWHPAKCSRNIADRGIDFADVLVGFIDPAKKVVRDDRKDMARFATTCWPKSTDVSSTSPLPNVTGLSG